MGLEIPTRREKNLPFPATIFIERFCEAHVVEAVFLEFCDPPFLEKDKSLGPVTGLPFLQGRAGHTVETDTVSPCLFDIIEKIKDRKGLHGFKNVGLKHRHIETANIEPDDQIRLLHPFVEFVAGRDDLLFFVASILVRQIIIEAVS